MFAEGSRDHANLTPLQAKEKAKKMIDTSGRTALRQLEKFSQIGAFSKTFSDLLIGQEGWYSTKCKLTWKLRGTRYGRMYFQLVPSTLLTDETGFGLLLKTPTVMDGEVTSGKKNPVSGNSGTLAQEIMNEYPPTMEKLGLLPTPTCQDAKGKENSISQRGKREIAVMAGAGMLPTPKSTDHKDSGRLESLAKLKETSPQYALMREVASKLIATPTVNDAINLSLYPSQVNRDSVVGYAMQGNPQAGETFQLNPRFVGEMMGFPPNYLELPFLNTETKV